MAEWAGPVRLSVLVQPGDPTWPRRPPPSSWVIPQTGGLCLALQWQQRATIQMLWQGHCWNAATMFASRRDGGMRKVIERQELEGEKEEGERGREGRKAQCAQFDLVSNYHWQNQWKVHSRVITVTHSHSIDIDTVYTYQSARNKTERKKMT